jgi:beta-galactosidase
MSDEIFPDGFLWGTATASYQIEGAVTEDGRGQSIWDTFAHTPGRVLNGDTGDIADDHYHRYADDVALMEELNVGAYRFSFAWPRLQPTGSGPLNGAGVSFYDRLLDELAAAGILPFPTLYHWDLPQALEDRGGWPLRDTASRFADYAAAVHGRFADRISDWTTLNEPACSAFLGYASGHHAPGSTDARASLRAAHHVLLGHGLAVAAMRESRDDLRYGITLNLYPVDPETDSDADRDAARRVDGVSNRIFLDPVLRGSYPADVLEDLGQLVDTDLIRQGDEATIAARLDMLGINYYSRHVVAAGPAVEPDPTGTPNNAAWVGCSDVVKVSRGIPVTAMGWEIDSQGLYDVLTTVTRDYDAPPLYITENGAAFDDVVSADGAVHDQPRIDYLRAHFAQAKRAIDDGVDLRGYFVWSLMDNFEWAWGYERRFGLIHIDYRTQARTIKDSGRWYASRISAHLESTAATG